MGLSDAVGQARWREPREGDLSAVSAAKDQQIARLSSALAAKDKEITELKARVVELEQWLARQQFQEITRGPRDPSLA
jgi:hypothetical protein